jgi:hypothetical protein
MKSVAPFAVEKVSVACLATRQNGPCIDFERLPKDWNRLAENLDRRVGDYLCDRLRIRESDRGSVANVGQQG